MQRHLPTLHCRNVLKKTSSMNYIKKIYFYEDFGYGGGNY